MRRAVLFLVAVSLLSSLRSADAADAPRLLVVVVIDQFRAEYLTTLASHWRAGFRTLLSDGANFTGARYPYLHTDTCAGHFTIGTGTLPKTHGMVGDRLWDRDKRREFECTEDDTIASVSYGRPSKIASSASRLHVPTLAEELRKQRPGARIVTLSLKARSAIGLAGHAGDAVTWFDDAAGAFVTSTAFAPRPVGAVKEFITAQPFQKDLGMRWTLRDPAESYRNGDAGVGERPPEGWTGLFPHVLSGKQGADAQFVGQWRRSPAADAYLEKLAVRLTDAYRLGRQETTDFLGVSFSTLDLVGHAFGPDSREAEDIAARLDDVLGDLITHLDATVGRARYVLALTSDHGAAPIPVPERGGRVAGEDIREPIEGLLRARYGARAAGPYVEDNYLGDIYLASDVRARLASDPAVVRAIREAVVRIPGVEQLLYMPELSEASGDAAVRAAALGSVAARNGDFIAVPKRGWVLIGRTSVDAASHGTHYDYDQRVPLVLLGAGIRRGTYDDASAPTDIAPTLAALAGVPLPHAEGRVLREGLAR